MILISIRAPQIAYKMKNGVLYVNQMCGLPPPVGNFPIVWVAHVKWQHAIKTIWSGTECGDDNVTLSKKKRGFM